MVSTKSYLKPGHSSNTTWMLTATSEQHFDSTELWAEQLWNLLEVKYSFCSHSFTCDAFSKFTWSHFDFFNSVSSISWRWSWINEAVTENIWWELDKLHFSLFSHSLFLFFFFLLSNKQAIKKKAFRFRSQVFWSVWVWQFQGKN